MIPEATKPATGALLNFIFCGTRFIFVFCAHRLQT